MSRTRGRARAADDLLIPYALDEHGRLVEPDEAVTGSVYRCPGCDGELTVRAVDSRAMRPHFAHPADVECGGETVLHWTAKYRIAQVVNDWLAGNGAAPQVKNACRNRSCKRTFVRPLPEGRFTRAEVERTLPSGRIVDVALVGTDEGVAAVVEILVTHAVDAAKAGDLAGTPVAELKALEAIDNPWLWKPERSLSRDVECTDCLAISAAFAKLQVPASWRTLHLDYDCKYELLRRGREILVAAYRPPAKGLIGRETLMMAVVAELELRVAEHAWHELRRLMSDHAAQATAALAQAPPVVAFYFEVQRALEEWGGRYLPTPKFEDFTRRREGPERWTAIRRVAEESGQPVPGTDTPYWTDVTRCFACRAEVLVYTWESHRWMEETPAPPEPRPPTLTLRPMKKAKAKYWANNCPYCTAPQGENYIYEPVGPLPARYAGNGNWVPRRPADFLVGPPERRVPRGSAAAPPPPPTARRAAPPVSPSPKRAPPPVDATEQSPFYTAWLELRSAIEEAFKVQGLEMTGERTSDLIKRLTLDVATREALASAVEGGMRVVFDGPSHISDALVEEITRAAVLLSEAIAVS